MFSKNLSKDSDRVQKLGQSILGRPASYPEHQFKDVTEKTLSMKIEDARKKLLNIDR
ncbi:MAG: hypothetical protein ACRCSV_04975 [Chlamydiales bacterium]